MCRLLEQLSDHNRGQPPRSADDPATAWRDTCTASLCERAATERRLTFSTREFSSPGHKGNHETPDTRRARRTSSPSVPPDAFLRPHLARSSPVARGNARPGSARSFHPRTKSLFLRPRRAHKRSTQRGSANTVITCHTRFRRPPGGWGGLKTALIRNGCLV